MMISRRRTRIAQLGIVALLWTSFFLTASPASAAPSNSPARFCAVLLGEAVDDNGSNVVVAESCSNRSAADAERGLTSASRVSTTAAVAAAPVLLMRWYQNANYGGYSKAFYGSYGTCDSAGYTFYADKYWSVNLSSITGSGRCTRVQAAHGGGTNYYLQLSAPSLPALLNDNVYFVRVYAG
jgi:hypothetical protein